MYIGFVFRGDEFCKGIDLVSICCTCQLHCSCHRTSPRTRAWPHWCVAWLNDMCDMTCWNVCHDSYSVAAISCMVSLVCHVTRWYVWHDIFKCVPWLIDLRHELVRGLTGVWRGSLICVTWHILKYVPWLIELRRQFAHGLTGLWHEPFLCVFLLQHTATRYSTLRHTSKLLGGYISCVYVCTRVCTCARTYVSVHCGCARIFLYVTWFSIE